MSLPRFWVGLVILCGIAYSAVARVRQERSEAALRAWRRRHDEPPDAPPAAEPD